MGFRFSAGWEGKVGIALSDPLFFFLPCCGNEGILQPGDWCNAIRNGVGPRCSSFCKERCAMGPENGG